jgi:hypothetical protein
MSPVEWGPLGPLDPAHNPQPSGGGGGGGGGWQTAEEIETLPNLITI